MKKPEAASALEVESPAAMPGSGPQNPFAALGLAPELLAVLDGLGFSEPTPIQTAAIPPLLSGRDVIGRARTGTGKTAAYGLPLITRVMRPGSRPSGKPRALVLAPTRELALQVTDALMSFAARPLRLITVYGGAPYGPQLRALKSGVEVVVGTPGRIIDLLERQALDLGELELFVLDEADEMLKMGFIEDVERVLSTAPSSRQIALFSATMPDPIRRVAEKWLKNPIEAADAKGASVEAIEQLYVQVPARNKREALVRVLMGEPRTAAIIFASTKIQCDEVCEMLQREGFPTEALHGDLSQPARERVVQQLRDRRLDLVVATDIAARGIDIDHLNLIINLDLPKNVEIYTHRIGRTGRAGRSGKAITFVTPRESWHFVQAVTRIGAKVQELFLPSEKELVERRRQGLLDEARRWLEAGGADVEVATAWADTLDPEDRESLFSALLGLLARERGVSLSPRLDAGLPPWARQPVVAAREVADAKRAKTTSVRPAAEKKEVASRPAPPPRAPAVEEVAPTRPAPTKPAVQPGPDRPSPAPKRPPAKVDDEVVEPTTPQPPVSPAKAKRAARVETPVAERRGTRAAPPPRAAAAFEPAIPGDAWIHIGVGRNDGVRPSDLVGALANELGLPGASIGRIEVRDQSSLVQVTVDFAERLGDGSWPLQVRRVDTEVKRHEVTQRATRLPQKASRSEAARLAAGPQKATPHGKARGDHAGPDTRGGVRAHEARPRKDGPPARPYKEGARRPASARPDSANRPHTRGAAAPSMGDRPPRRSRDS